MWRRLAVLCWIGLPFLLTACGYKACIEEPRRTCWLGPLARPARHLVVPGGLEPLLVYDCLTFAKSDYWPETADIQSTCFEFFQVTCNLQTDELVDYYERNLQLRGWTVLHKLVTEDKQILVFEKDPHHMAIDHYTEQGVEVFSLWRSPCESDWEEHHE